MKPFTYLLTHKGSGKQYYGVKCGKNTDPSMLWTSYFSSSKIVKGIIAEEGADAFVAEVRKVFKTREEALRWEHRFLTRVGAAKSPRWYNRQNGGKSFTCTGHSEKTRRLLSQKLAGRTLSEIHKKRIAAKSTWAGKLTPKQIAARALKVVGTVHDPEGVERMRQSKIGLKRVYAPDGSFKMVRP